MQQNAHLTEAIDGATHRPSMFWTETWVAYRAFVDGALLGAGLRNAFQEWLRARHDFGSLATGYMGLNVPDFEHWTDEQKRHWVGRQVIEFIEDLK